MSRRAEVKTEVAATPVESAESAAIEAANAQALKDAEAAKVSEEPPAGACEVWGQCDLNSKACKGCEVIDLCKVKTASLKPQKAARVAGAPKAVKQQNGELSKFNLARIGTRSSDLDAALEEFKTYDQLAAIFTLSTVKAHIKWLQAKRSERCHLVTDAEGRVRMELNEGVK